MRTPHRLLLPFACLALVGLLACSRSEQPSSTAGSKPAAAPTSAAAPAPAAAPTAPPAGWKTVTNDNKTCRISLPTNWSDQGMGMFGGPPGTMLMFIEDEQTQKAGNWDPVRAEITKKKSSGAKVEVLEDSPNGIVFQAPQGSVLAVMAFRRSPKTLCVAQIAVPAGDPAQQKVAKQIADSLTPVP